MFVPGYFIKTEKDRRIVRLEDKCMEYKERLDFDYELEYASVKISIISKKLICLFNHFQLLLISLYKTPFLWCKVPKASSSSWVDLFIAERQIFEENSLGNF